VAAARVLQLDGRRTLLRGDEDAPDQLTLSIGWEDLAEAFHSPVSSLSSAGSYIPKTGGSITAESDRRYRKRRSREKRAVRCMTRADFPSPSARE
jgi:hypothetical protein